MLQKRNELHSYLLSKRINGCPSGKEQLVYVVNEFCRECPECCRVFECDDYEQFQEENRGRSFTAPNSIRSYLKTKVFPRWNIEKMFSSNEVAFLSNVIAQFEETTDNSVNYSCFLHNYFEIVSSDCWPHKKEILKTISNHLPKNFETRLRAKQKFEKWLWSNNQGSS